MFAYYYTENKVDGSSFTCYFGDREKSRRNPVAWSNIGHGGDWLIGQCGKPSTLTQPDFQWYSCTHLFDEKRLFFFHNTLHALKNLKESFLNNDSFKIPPLFVEKYALSSIKICVDHFPKLISEQETIFLAINLSQHVNWKENCWIRKGILWKCALTMQLT